MVLVILICNNYPGVVWKIFVGGRARRGEYSFVEPCANSSTRLANNANALALMVSIEAIMWIEYFDCLCLTATRMLLLSAIRDEV